jgi:hypothetical protein
MVFDYRSKMRRLWFAKGERTTRTSQSNGAFLKGHRYLPSRIVMLDGSGNLTFDVLAWLSEQSIPLVQIDWQGTVVNMAGNIGYSADRKLLAAQVAAKSNGLATLPAKLLCSAYPCHPAGFPILITLPALPTGRFSPLDPFTIQIPNGSCTPTVASPLR